MSTPPPAAERPPAFSFTGTGGEYFGIWIVNLALSIVTLGIFSAWAKVRTLKYFYGHTQLAGERFDYLANPVRILIGRIIAVTLLIGYSICVNLLPDVAFLATCVLALLIPLILVMAAAFRARNTAWRNIRMHLHVDVGAAYRAALPPIVVVLLIAGVIFYLIPETVFDPESGQEILRTSFLPSLIMLGVLPVLPWLDHIRTKFIIGHTHYGNIRAAFDATVGDFYILYLKLTGAFVGVFVSFFILAILIAIVGAFISAGLGEPDTPSAGIIVATVIGFIVLYAALFLLLGWFGALRNNLIRNHTRFGDNQMYGHFRGRDLAWITFSNIVATVFTLGLFIPWALTRLARYNAEHTDMDTDNLEDVVAVATAERSAIGEEVGAFFDIDLGL